MGSAKCKCGPLLSPIEEQGHVECCVVAEHLGRCRRLGPGPYHRREQGRRRAAGALAAVEFSRRYARHRRNRDCASPLRAQEYTGNVRHRGVHQARQRFRKRDPARRPQCGHSGRGSGLPSRRGFEHLLGTRSGKSAAPMVVRGRFGAAGGGHPHPAHIRRRGARRSLPAIRGLDLGRSRSYQRPAQIQPSISHLEVEQGPARI